MILSSITLKSILEVVQIIVGVGLFTFIGFLIDHIGKRKKKYQEEFTGSYAGFVTHPKSKPRFGGRVYSGIIMPVNDSHRSFFKGMFWYGETEHVAANDLRQSSIGSYRVILKINYWLSAINIIIRKKFYAGKLYLVDVSTSGFRTFTNKGNLIAEYDIEHYRSEERINVSLVKVYRKGMSQELPEYFKIYRHSSDYFDPYQNVTDIVFRIHPNLDI